MKLKDLIRGELIGLDVMVLGKPIKGMVIDESKNLLVIETSDKKRKKIIKQNNVFEFFVNGKAIKIDGKLLAVRPEDRIKIKV